MRFLELLRALLTFSRIDQLDEAAIRDLLKRAIPFAKDLAEKTGTTYDDIAIDELADVVENDAVWSWFSGLVHRFTPAPPVVGDTIDAGKPACEAFNPLWIELAVQIAGLIADWVKNRKAA